jgi:predicted dehydrogenase
VFTPIFRLLDLDFPERVLGGGGNFQYSREVPDQCNLIADYAGGPSVVLMNSLSNFTGIDTIIRGTDGLIKFGDIEHFGPGIRIVPVDKAKKEVMVPWRGAGDTQKLWDNFIQCVKTRQRPFSPIDIAVRVQAPLNMAILSHRENKVAKYDKATGKIVMG